MTPPRRSRRAITTFGQAPQLRIGALSVFTPRHHSTILQFLSLVIPTMVLPLVSVSYSAPFSTNIERFSSALHYQRLARPAAPDENLNWRKRVLDQGSLFNKYIGTHPGAQAEMIRRHVPPIFLSWLHEQVLSDKDGREFDADLVNPEDRKRLQEAEDANYSGMVADLGWIPLPINELWEERFLTEGSHLYRPRTIFLNKSALLQTYKFLCDAGYQRGMGLAIAGWSRPQGNTDQSTAAKIRRCEGQ